FFLWVVLGVCGGWGGCLCLFCVWWFWLVFVFCVLLWLLVCGWLVFVFWVLLLVVGVGGGFFFFGGGFLWFGGFFWVCGVVGLGLCLLFGVFCCCFL
ncbi:hypothetical protein ACTHTR_10875, partial [Neisseria sp. P0018.S004]